MRIDSEETYAWFTFYLSVGGGGGGEGRLNKNAEQPSLSYDYVSDGSNKNGLLTAMFFKSRCVQYFSIYQQRLSPRMTQEFLTTWGFLRLC